MENQFTNVAAYRFGPFTLDPMRRLLCFQSEARGLPEKPFRTLLLLLRANGTLVSKEEFFRGVWGDDACISDANLVQQIAMLRKLLSDHDADSTYILTVSGEGYRFAQAISAPLGELAAATPVDSFGLYCKASHFIERRTKRDLNASVLLFRESLDRNPNYGPAWLGLSRAYALLGEYAYASPSDSFPQARKAIDRGLTIDSMSIAGKALLSEIQMFGDWDFDAAERSLSEALSLNPQSGIARHNLAWFHLCSANFDSAVSEAKHALIQDPTSMAFLLILGRALMLRGDIGEAVLCFTDAIEIEPGNYWAHLMRAIAFILIGAPQRAIDDLTTVDRQGPELPLLARAFANLGDLQSARGAFAELESLAQTQYVSHWDYAVSFAATDREAEACESLGRAFERREPLPLLLPGLRALFGTMTVKPRFRALIARSASLTGSRNPSYANRLGHA